MTYNKKYILAAIAACVLVVPAFSQGQGRDGLEAGAGWGGDSHPGEGAGVQEQGSGTGSGEGYNHGGDLLTPRFNNSAARPKEPMDENGAFNQRKQSPDGQPLGPKTRLQDDNPTRPIDAPGEEPLMDGQQWRTFGTKKSLMDNYFPEKPPKKSLMKHQNKKYPKSLMDKHAPEKPPEPPKKSLMKTHHKRPIKSLMDDYFPKRPPMKSIMGPWEHQ